MYQIEVKRHLIEKRFPPSEGWKVTIDIDAMEMGLGDQNPPEKQAIVNKQLEWMEKQGVTIAPHPEYGCVDIVAEHSEYGRFLVEAEGDTRRQKVQAIYSVLGQVIIMMEERQQRITYGLAVPDEMAWINQISKIPKHVCDLLNLRLYLVSKDGVKEVNGVIRV
jgi:hypothetical protein